MVGAALSVTGLASVSHGQPSQPVTTEPAWELPEDVRAGLSEVEDFTFNFDQPGFYAVLSFVKRNPRSPGYLQSPIEVQDGRELLERPSEFRGRPITIEGVVGRNKDPYALPTHSDLGLISQLELSRQNQPVTCTVILTEGASDIPVGATIRVTGYFVMIRQYHGPSRRLQQAALVIAPGPSVVERGGARRALAAGPDWRWMVGAAALGLVIAVILLRRSAGQSRTNLRTLHASQEAPMNLADDLAQWSAEEPRDDR